MIKRVLYNGITWIDIDSPSAEEITDIAHECNLHPLIVSELLSPSLRPKIEIHKDYIYIILHFIDNKEVDFVLGKDFILTTRYGEVEPMIKLSQSLHQGEQIHDKHFNAGVFFYYITKGLYQEMENDILRMRNHMQTIESSIFAGEERAMVLELAKTGRTILNTHQALDPHKEVLQLFKDSATHFFGKTYEHYAKNLLHNFQKAHQRIQRISALQNELRATNDSLLSAKQNSIMQVFTIVAFLTLIPSLISSIFGMNARHMPFIGNEYDFWLILLIMLIASLSVLSFFKHKRWL